MTGNKTLNYLRFKQIFNIIFFSIYKLYIPKLLTFDKNIFLYRLCLYKWDALGSFTVYVVVACCRKIHTNSARTNDSGRYAKVIDQVKNCFDLPWRNHHPTPGWQKQEFILSASMDILIQQCFAHPTTTGGRPLISWLFPTTIFSACSIPRASC